MDMELKKVSMRLILSQQLLNFVLFQAFTEMQVNKIESTKKIRILDVQIDTLRKQKQRFELTSKEVGNLTDTAKVYAAVGRMFVMSSVPEIKDELKQKSAKVEKVIETCDKSKGVLIQNLQEQESNLREMVDAKKKESK